MVIDNLGTQTIETKRLVLRRFKRSDADNMIKYWISLPEVQNNYGEPCSIEAKIVFDADKLDIIGAIGVARLINKPSQLLF